MPSTWYVCDVCSRQIPGDIFELKTKLWGIVCFQALKQELVDTRDEHNRERRELEMSQNELIK